MFEGVLYQLLAGYLGHYVKDINREHFRLGLWSGEAFLENVEIRLEAFDHLQLPFAIKQGLVGKLRLQVPWSKLGWEPILIALEDVTLLAGPHEDSEYGAEASERRALAAKKVGLAAAEFAKLSQRVSEDKSGQTFLSYLCAKIIDNVQVTVTKVHIQYVDGKTDPERVFSFGIILSSLTISTTDGRDHPVLPGVSTAGKSGGNRVYKLVEVKQLALYWNSDKEYGSPLGTSVGDDGFRTMHSFLIPEEDVVYLLRPTNATLRLTVDRKATQGGGPIYSVAANVDDLSLALMDRQLVQMLLLIDVLSMSRLRERYARFRPQISIADSESARIGWQRRLWVFAIQAVLSDVRKHLRRSSWSYFSWRSERQKRYVRSYKEKLESLHRVQSAGDQKWAELEEMEREFEMDEILYFRSLAENQFQLSQDDFMRTGSDLDDKESDQREAGELSQQPLGHHRGWLNWLSLGLLGAAESIDAAVCPDEIIKDLCEAAADFNTIAETESKKSERGECWLILSVRVGVTVACLRNSLAKKEIVRMSVGGTLVTFSFWQDASSISITVTTLEIVDLCKPASQFSRILSPKTKRLLRSSSSAVVYYKSPDARASRGIVHSSSENSLYQANSHCQGESMPQSLPEQIDPLIKVEVEMNNKTRDFDVTVNVTIQPLECVYSPTLVDQTLDFFCEPLSLHTRHELVVSGSKKLETIAGHTRAKAEFAFATRKRVGWHLDMQRPTFLFPENAVDPEGMLMIWAWESLFITSAEIKSIAFSSADTAASQRLWNALGSTRCYERLEVNLVGVQVIVVGQTSSWNERSRHGTDLGSHVLENFSLQIAVCCLPSDPTTMSRFKMSGEISTLKCRVSFGKCSVVKAVVARMLESWKRIKSKYKGVKDGYPNVELGVQSPNLRKATCADSNVNTIHKRRSSSLQDSNQGHRPAVLELNLTLKIITMQLSLDGQSDSELQHMTLMAQMQETTLRLKHWASRDDLLFMVSRVHIEDANELAGSSLRYLLFYSDGSSSVLKEASSSSGAIAFTTLQRISNRCCFVAKFSSHSVNYVRNLRLDLSLQRLECYCLPKVMRALCGFILKVTDIKTPVVAVESLLRSDSLDRWSGSYTAQTSRESTLVDAESDPVLTVGVKLKDVAFHLYDPGGIIGILVLADASSSVSFMPSRRGVFKVVAVVREVKVKGPRWTSGNVGGDPFGNSSNGPAATLNLTISKTLKRNSFSGLEYSVTEVDVAIQNVRWILQNDYFALLVGYFISSDWRLPVKKNNLEKPEDLGSGSVSSDSGRTVVLFKVEVSDSVVLFPGDSDVEEYMELNIPKLLASFTPAKLARMEGNEASVLSESFPGGVDIAWVECRDVAVIFLGFRKYLEPFAGDQFRLVENVEGKIIIKIPTSQVAAEVRKTGISNGVPTVVEIDLSHLHLTLAGLATTKGVELLKRYRKEVSSISRKYKTYASTGSRSGLRDRSPPVQLTTPRTSNSSLSLKFTISQLTVFLRGPDDPSVNVSRLQADSVNMYIFRGRGVMEVVKLEVLSLELLHGAGPKTLLSVTAEDYSNGGGDSPEDLIPLLSLANSELQIALPCTKVWLHLFAWSKIIRALSSLGSPPSQVKVAKHENATSLSSPDQILSQNGGHSSASQLRNEVLSDGGIMDSSDSAVDRGIEFASNPLFGTSKTEDARPVLKVGVSNVVFILPDYIAEAEADVLKTKQSRSKLLWTGLGGHAENISVGRKVEGIQDGDRSMGKKIILTWSVRVDEIQINRKGLCTLCASIMHAEAAVEEIFEEGQRFHMRFLQANDIRIKGQADLEHSLKNSFLGVEVDCVDTWFSYNTLHFVNGFHLEPVKTRSLSSATEFYFSLDLRLQSCSLSLSDSRWSCNAPIFEIVLKEILCQVVWNRFDIEASVSTDLEIYYHNIQKVAWEPLVEPWSICSKITRLFVANVPSSSRPFRTKFELTSSAPININVTESLIQAISRSAEMFSDSWKGKSGDDASSDFKIREPQSAESSSMRRYAPYWLQNDTGVPLSYSLCGASSNKESDDGSQSSSFGSGRSSWGSLSTEVVQPGCSVPLYVEERPDEVFVRRGAGKSAGYNARKMFNMLLLHRKICVQLEGTSRPSVPLSIDLVGSVYFEAVFSDDSADGGSRPSKGSFQEIETERRGSFSAPVIFEVTVQRYSKLVRVCSMVSLVNTTSVALELRFDIPFLISPKVMDPILPGHVMALPVHLAETGRMRWRPVGNNYLWSEVQLLQNLLEVADTRLGFHRPVVCYPVNPSNGAFRYCITVGNHLIPAAEAGAASKCRGEQRDVMGRTNGVDNLGIGSCSGSDDTTGCTLWNIFLKAPLVVKNCLPCSLAVTIETGGGIMSNVSAPEGDSIFVHELDTIQDLNLRFLASNFLPSSMKVASAASFSLEMGRNVAQDMKVTVTQQLLFNPEVTTNASVTVDVEINVDLMSGAREVRMSSPFWLYNCSYLNLVVMDGDVDLFSGREQPLGGGPTNDKEWVEELSLQSTGSRSWPTSVNGLKAALDRKLETGDRVVRKPAEFSSQPNRFLMFHGPVDFNLDNHLGQLQEGILEDSRGHSLEMQEKIITENASGQFLMYSPVQGTDASELHLRVSIARSVPKDIGKEWGEVRWSRPFLLEPPGGTTAVAIPQPEGNGAFVVTVISAPALGSCAGKTKTITFRPRFLLANVSKQVLCYKQQGTDEFQRLERGKHSQLHWHDVSREFLVSMRIDEHGWDWSGGFAPDQLGDTQVKVRNHTTGKMHMLRVEVSSMLASARGAQIAGPSGVSLGTFLILLSDDETGFMPYRIENFSLERLRFHQQKCEKMENMLLPYSSCSYAWDEPCRPHRLIIEVPGAGDLGAFGLDDVKEYPPVTLPATSEKAERKWLVHVRAEGPIRVLSIVDGTVHTMKGSAGFDVVSSGDQMQETGQNVEPNRELFEEFTVNLSYLGFSVIDTQPQEVIYACAKGIKLQFLQGRHQQVLKLDVAWLQVDNQLRYAVYPVMLSVARAQPEVVPQGTRTDIQPIGEKDLQLSKDATFSISIAKWTNPTGSVDCFQYIRMRLEPLRLELEERAVSCLLHLFEAISWSAYSTDSCMFVDFDSEPWSVLHGSQLYGSSMQPFVTIPWKYDMVYVPTSNLMRFTKLVQRLDAYRCWASAVAVEPINWQSQKLFLFAKGRRKAYIEMLHVAPVVLNVSFSSAPWLSDELGGSATRSLLWMTGTVLQRQVRALADVEGAPVHLRQLKLAHPFASWDVIRGMITRHYTRQLLQEVYKVLGSADVFGNPVGFIRSMASGMWEFVSAPTRSSVQSPTELVRGVAQGTSSLFTNTVFAFSNAATRISRAARKGVTIFTLDSEYDQAMERMLRLEGSQEVSVVNEFLEGLTGLLQAPIRGAERHGLPGMLSGMALGVVGVVARPVASILEVAGMTAQSIRNRSRPIQWHAARVRLPRHVDVHSPLMLYSWERALGQAVFLEAEGGRLKNEVYFTCKPLVQEGKFLLLTETKILRVTTDASNAVYWRKWKVDLEGEIDDILHVDQVDNQVSVLLGPPMRPLIRPHHQGTGSSKYTTRFTPFAHETFALLSQSASDEVLGMLRLLDEQHRRARSKLLLASSTSISSPEFLDLDRYF